MTTKAILRTMHVVAMGLMLAGCDTGPKDALAEVEQKAKKCKNIDSWEPNGSAEKASRMNFQFDGYDFIADVDAYLCAGEEDWYRFETAYFDFEDPHMLMFAEINDGHRCAAACGNPVVKPGPKYEMSVEVYRADTMEMLESGTSDDGEIILGGQGEYLHDILVRVYSEREQSKYTYSLWAVLTDGPFGDDCEC